MIPVPVHSVCIVEQCLPAVLVHQKSFSDQALKMRAIVTERNAMQGALSTGRAAVPEEPSGGASGGGALLGGEGAPGSGTGIPGAIMGRGRF